MVLEEKQFEVGGVAFGLDCPVRLKADGWNPGPAATRTQDVELPGSDGVRMGKDLKGGATWAFSLYTNGADEDEAWESLSYLADVWDDESIRLESEAVVPLRYRVAGRTRRVYGRPRRWTPTINNTSMGGRIDIEADFGLVSHLIFDDSGKSERISINPPLELDAGLEVPFEPPFDTSAGAAERESTITIGGRVSTPITVTFEGPVLNPSVRVGGWTAQVLDYVFDDDPVTIDGRPWVRSATRRSGGAVRVSPRVTRISKMWLPPGTHEVVFTGDDLSGTAAVVISWHDAYRSPR